MSAILVWLKLKLIRGTDTQTDRQVGDVIRLHFSFGEENRLKIQHFNLMLAFKPN